MKANQSNVRYGFNQTIERWVFAFQNTLFNVGPTLN